MVAEVMTVTNVLYYGLVLAASLFFWFQWRYRDLLRIAAKLPYTFPAWPLLGHGYFMFWGLEQGTNYILEMSRRAIEKGFKTICFWCGPLPYLVIHDLEDVQTIMNCTNTLDKGEEYEFFKVGLDSGVGPFKYSLVTAPGPVWKVTRRHMNMLFVPRNLEQMVPVFNKNSRSLMDRLEVKVGGGPTELNIMDPIMDTSLKTICDFLFGPDNEVHINSKEFLGLKSIVERIPEIFIKRVTQPWLRWDPVFLFIYKKELEEINKKLKTFTELPLKATKEKYDSKMKSTPLKTNEEDDDKEKEGLLNILDVYKPFQAKNPQFTEADMRGEMFTLYETGSDTVASITSYCLMSLAQYPEYQDKLYSEIASVAGVGPDDDVTVDHIHKMTYLDQCLKETLRRFTLVPYLLRRTSDDVKLSECTVPADHTVVISTYGIHMNPKIYPDPERFDPDRFSPENVASRSKYTFVPFSGGPRDCIGKKYGMLIMKVMLVHILRRYKVHPVVDIHKIRRKLVVALVSTEGYRVQLEARARAQLT